MIWGWPGAFWFAAVGLPVVAIFLYRRFTHLTEVPAVLIWRNLGQPVESKAFFLQLRRVMSLLMQLLIVTLLMLALADPWPRKKGADRTILVIDVSATMQTREGLDTRMELARADALRILRQTPAGSEVMVVCAADHPEIALPATKELDDARRCIAQCQSLDVDSDLPRAVRAAESFLDPAVASEIVVISDFAGLDPRRLTVADPGHCRLQLIPVGADHGDVAISGMFSEPDENGRRVVATIEARGISPKALPVRFIVNGQQVANQQVTLSDKPATVNFQCPMHGGDVFEIVVDSGDPLAADDHVFGVVARRDDLSICLVTEGNPTLERALGADPAVALHKISHAMFNGSMEDPVVVIDGPGVITQPRGKALGYLFINTADPFGWSTPAGRTNCEAPTHWAGDHPSMSDADPTLFRVAHAIQLNWSPRVSAAEIVGAQSVSLVMEATVPVIGQNVTPPRALYWLFDPNDGTLPRRLSFPLLLWNAIDYLKDGSVDVKDEMLATGSELHLPAAPGGNAPAVVDPLGNRMPVRRAPTGWSVGDAVHAGIYQVGGEKVAINWLSNRGLAVLPPSNYFVDAPELQLVKAKPSWWYWLKHLSWRQLLCVAALVGAGEWLLFNRRIVRIA